MFNSSPLILINFCPAPPPITQANPHPPRYPGTRKGIAPPRFPPTVIFRARKRCALTLLGGRFGGTGLSVGPSESPHGPLALGEHKAGGETLGSRSHNTRCWTHRVFGSSHSNRSVTRHPAVSWLRYMRLKSLAAARKGAGIATRGNTPGGVPPGSVREPPAAATKFFTLNSKEYYA